MPVLREAEELWPDMVRWRRDFHAHPETAFEEHRTSQRVASLLDSLGLQTHRGLAGTGVVATLARGDGPSIGLRADLDALHIQEMNDFEYRSRTFGKMHACGHDGHTAMLLGAASHLARAGNFRGTIHFIFQPAEENEGGGRRMIEDGLFDLFPMEAVFGMHNFPGLEVGRFALRAGPFLAANDVFEIVVQGRGGHAAFPQTVIDPVVIAAQITLALQTVVSRQISPLDAAVVSVTQVHGGESANVIPDQVKLLGTSRCFTAGVRHQLEESLRRIAAGIAEAAGASIRFSYERRYPATVNADAQAKLAAEVAREVAGASNVDSQAPLVMGSEDFAFMLEARPGAYILIGNGPTEAGGPLHSPLYDFNDDILPLGASYWIRLAERALPA